MVSYHWTFMKQEANIRAKPHLWSVVTHQKLERVTASQPASLKILEVFLTLNYRVIIRSCVSDVSGSVLAMFTGVVWTWWPENMYSELLGDGIEGFLIFFFFFFHKMSEKQAPTSRCY